MLRKRNAAEFVGVLGWPLDHTLSPVIHNAAFRRLGLEWIYLAWAVPPEALGDAIRGLRALGGMGANVTMPHKEAVIEHLDELSGDARSVGAVNTVQRLGDRLVGHNTDVDGFRDFVLSDAGYSVEGKRALVLGAGGAARAVVRALDQLGASEIAIAARHRERGATLLPIAVRGRAELLEWGAAGAASTGTDVIVNATPAGADATLLPDAAFRPGQLVVDLVYSPPATPLVERARAAGADAWGGIGMLVHQAAASLQIWTGQDPPLETMSAAAVHALGAAGQRSRP